MWFFNSWGNFRSRDEALSEALGLSAESHIGEVHDSQDRRRVRAFSTKVNIMSVSEPHVVDGLSERRRVLTLFQQWGDVVMVE